MSKEMKQLSRLLELVAMPTEGFSLHLDIHLRTQSAFEAFAAALPMAKRSTLDIPVDDLTASDGRYFDLLSLPVGKVDIYGPRRQTFARLALVADDEGAKVGNA